MTYFNDPPMPRFEYPADAPEGNWCDRCDLVVDTDDPFETACTCDPDAFCTECGEELPEDDDACCKNCCECEVCFPDSERYWLPDTIGVPREFDISRIQPSRKTLELAAADDPKIAENEEFKPFIQLCLDWTEERSWIYTSQAMLNRGYTEFVREVTASAINFDELTN